MKKNICVFAITVSIIIGLNFAIGTFLDIKYALKDDVKLSEAVQNNADIALIGSSVMYNQYNPHILQDSLGLNVYNYGYGGQNIFYHYVITDLLIKESFIKPKLIIYQPSSIDLDNEDGKNLETINTLYSGYNKYSTIRDIVELQGEKTVFMIKYFPLYKHNNRLISYISHTLRKNDGDKGFKALHKTWDGVEQLEDPQTTIDSIKVSYLERMVELCKKNNIKLVIEIAPSPYYNKYNNTWLGVIRKLSAKHEIPLYNHIDDETFLQHYEWFYDQAHLNYLGADFYTRSIVNEIRMALANDK